MKRTAKGEYTKDGYMVVRQDDECAANVASWSIYNAEMEIVSVEVAGEMVAAFETKRDAIAAIREL